MRPFRQILIASVLAVVAALGAPAVANAKGGPGGATPPPVQSAQPCATLVGPPNGSVNITRTITVKYDITSCATTTQTVSLVFTRTWSYQPALPTGLATPPIECSTVGWTGPTVTLRAGDKTSVSSVVPPRTCPVGGRALTAITANLMTATGLPLASTITYYNVTPNA